MLFNPNSLDDLLGLLDIIGIPPGSTELLVAGADHGIAKEGVSKYAFGQTSSILKISASSRSPVSRLCDEIGVQKAFFNVGCALDCLGSGINNNFLFGRGTKNFLNEQAMDQECMLSIFEAASAYVQASKARQFCLGEVGVGNTCSSSAILGAMLGENAKKVTGSGSGVPEEVFQRKIKVIQAALERHRLEAPQKRPLQVLCSLGGFEIAWNVGIILAAKDFNRVVLLDGFITSIAAFIAFTYDPQVIKHVIATHLSKEPGHRYILDAMGLRAFLHLNMALGQGFGAVLAYSFAYQTNRSLGRHEHALSSYS